MKKLKIFAIMLILSVVGFTGYLKAPPSIDKDVGFDDVYAKAYAWHMDQLREAEIESFANHLGYIESRSDWQAINEYGYMGTWQFGTKTLKRLGHDITPAKFKENKEIFPQELQYKCLKLLINVNLADLKKYNDYVGLYIGDTYITRSGMLAAAHLGGVRSVKLFLESAGKVDPSDANGTRISQYMKEFGIYHYI